MEDKTKSIEESTKLLQKAMEELKSIRRPDFMNQLKDVRTKTVFDFGKTLIAREVKKTILIEFNSEAEATEFFDKLGTKKETRFDLFLNFLKGKR